MRYPFLYLLLIQPRIRVTFQARMLAFPEGFLLPFQVLSSASILPLSLISDRVSEGTSPFTLSQCVQGLGHVGQQLITFLPGPCSAEET